MAIFCQKPFALPPSYEIGDLEWVSLKKNRLFQSCSVDIRLWCNKPSTAIVSMYVLLTIFEISAPIYGILHTHYAKILTTLTTGGELVWETRLSPTNSNHTTKFSGPNVPCRCYWRYINLFPEERLLDWPSLVPSVVPPTSATPYWHTKYWFTTRFMVR